MRDVKRTKRTTGADIVARQREERFETLEDECTYIGHLYLEGEDVVLPEQVTPLCRVVADLEDVVNDCLYGVKIFIFHLPLCLEKAWYYPPPP